MLVEKIRNKKLRDRWLEGPERRPELKDERSRGVMKTRVVLYCLLAGLAMTIATLGAGHFAWWWLSGAVMAAAFVPVALFGPRSALGQFGAIVPVMAIVTVLCTWSEGVMFIPMARPHAVHDLIGALVLYLIMVVVLAALAWALRLPKSPASTPDSVDRRSLAGVLVMVLVCGVVYEILYLVTGGITYQFFTKKYYPDAVQIAGSFGLWLWVIQFGRGVLMTLAVLPAIYTLRMPRWQSAISIGILIWVAGGLALLLVPNPAMGATQRMIHTIEILTQNAPLGIIAVLLLRPKSTATLAAHSKVAAASV
jgi:hypothetical protein